MIFSPPEKTRHEVKFVGQELVYHDLVQWVRVNGAGFRTEYPPRRINNIYFDTYDLATYEANLSGCSRRLKVRYRWYGALEAPAAGSLEVKCKRNAIGWKLAEGVKAPLELAGESWAAIRRDLAGRLSPVFRETLAAYPQPVLANSYRRDYFISFDGRLRITLDTEQEVLDQRAGRAPNFRNRSNLPRTVILEVKCLNEDRGLASAALANIPLRISKSSKYVSGVAAIFG